MVLVPVDTLKRTKKGHYNIFIGCEFRLISIYNKTK